MKIALSQKYFPFGHMLEQDWKGFQSYDTGITVFIVWLLLIEDPKDQEEALTGLANFGFTLLL